MSFLCHVLACNQYTGVGFIPFLVDGARVGMMRRAFAERLAEWPDLFRVSRDRVDLLLPGASVSERSSAVAAVLSSLAEQGVISHLHGEQYVATAGTREQGILMLDRAAAPYFGIRAFGQHMNGYVQEAGELKLWLGRRADDRIHYPGCLDNLVAGGLPATIGMDENLAKECREEAGIGPELVARARPVGAITYNLETEKGLKPDTLYCYDLELPPGFRPRCTDGEVAGFELLSIQDVMKIVFESDEFKLNCNLVVIDFCIRHGYLSPYHDEFHDLITGLHPHLAV
jgi:8-oxo-dGTP pyrophosphatase MutT (NUDIX family)